MIGYSFPRQLWLISPGRANIPCKASENFGNKFFILPPTSFSPILKEFNRGGSFGELVCTHLIKLQFFFSVFLLNAFLLFNPSNSEENKKIPAHIVFGTTLYDVGRLKQTKLIGYTSKKGGDGFLSLIGLYGGHFREERSDFRNNYSAKKGREILSYSPKTCRSVLLSIDVYVE